MISLKFTTFTFVDRRFDPATGEVRLEYALDDLSLVEVLRFPAGQRFDADALGAALDMLHWIAGVSYWKTACPPHIRFATRAPDAWQAQALTRLYREGLAEFAWRNGLDPDAWPDFPAEIPPFACEGGLGGMPSASEDTTVQTRFARIPPGPPSEEGGSSALPSKVLCPLGGGKDSLVALERLRAMGEDVTTFATGKAPLIAEVAEATGAPHLWVRRQLAPELVTLNQQGAYNGHIPITAINQSVGVVLALLGGFDSVVFANERSADEPTLIDGGRTVNHQFAKSFAWERVFDDWVRRYIAADLNCFSLLRRERELAICRQFAGLTRYHDVFSSCNRNFHLDGPRTTRWCGQCPKCHFVYLGLAPFVQPRRLEEIFGADLLNDPGQAAGFRALLGLDGAKPFECVGEAAESRAALAALAQSDAWRDRAVVRTLAPELVDVEVPALEDLLRPTGPHRIPQRFAHAV